MNPELPDSWRPFVSTGTSAKAVKADLAKIQPAVTPNELELVKSTIAPQATPEELKLYLYDCARQGVHPLDKLIHFTKRGGKYTPVTSIDLMRIRAAETGEYAGSDDALFGDLLENRWPVSATVTVWRLVQGQRCAFTATARWSEYKPEGQDFMWRRMPHTMLGKCAEALALRKGFPKQLAGLYAKEEMDQAGQDKAERVVVQPVPSPSLPAAPSIPTEAEMGFVADAEGEYLAEVRDGKRGTFEVITEAGEAFSVYQPSARPTAEEAVTLHLRVRLTKKTAKSSGHVYVSEIRLLEGRPETDGAF